MRRLLGLKLLCRTSERRSQLIKTLEGEALEAKTPCLSMPLECSMRLLECIRCAHRKTVHTRIRARAGQVAQYGSAIGSSASAEGPCIFGMMHCPCAGRCMHAHASCARCQGTCVQKSKDQVSGLPGLHDGSIASAIGLRVRATCAARSALPVGGGGWCRSGRCSLGLLVCAGFAKPAQ